MSAGSCESSDDGGGRNSGSEEVPGSGGVVPSCSCCDDCLIIALVCIGAPTPKSCLRSSGSFAADLKDAPGNRATDVRSS